MSLLLRESDWSRRIAAARGPLAPLVQSLAHDLEPLLARVEAGALYVPVEKALLSRAGGRCPNDGELLEFEPFEPHEHRCPRCGIIWRGEWHDRFWPYWYQLWLAERAVQGALLHRLAGERRYQALAIAILDAYVDRYPTYPNRDNVLGPSRPFFSTYLESIWLLQIVLACDMLEGSETSGMIALGQRVRDVIVEPSLALIASYDEGMSNRQVWNNAAMLAGRMLLGEPDAVERALDGGSGLLAHLGHALLPDGTWYEGENYHLFAHRGLWYSVAMLEARGLRLEPELARRFDEGFVTPLLTALPDLTLPSRRDSQYAISLRQPRFAESAELGLARRSDDRLRALLTALYDGTAPEGDTGRARSTADVERNRTAIQLTRADLGWRALLHALPEVDPLDEAPLSSAHLPSQGIAVFRRRQGRQYVALDYGHSGGGHGHPDRLNLLIADGATRWLDDMGTGSYVDRSLHWYRSTLAHNAPLVDGRSQRRGDGWLEAFDERGGAGWIRAGAVIAPEVAVRRSIVVLDGYLVDEIRWTASREVTIDLPMHLDGEVSGGRAWLAGVLSGGDGLEDGFEHLRDVELLEGGAAARFDLRAASGADSLAASVLSEVGGELWRAIASSAPGVGVRRFHLLRTRAPIGRVVSVWSLDGTLAEVTASAEAIVARLADGAEHRHSAVSDGWHIEMTAAGARSSIDLGGVVAGETPPAIDVQPSPSRDDTPTLVIARTTVASPWLSDLPQPANGAVRRLELGEPHYIRSEPTWTEAGEPTARVLLAHDGESLVVEVQVDKAGPLTLTPDGAENPYDNEPPEVNGDAVQLYLRTPAGGSGGWMLVPDASGAMRIRHVSGWPNGGVELRDPRWRRTPRGYTVRAGIALQGARRCDVALLVNDIEPGRMRRRGQLSLAGGGGFVYLRGDRFSGEPMLTLQLD